MTRPLVTFCFGVLFASGLLAQTADATMKSFISAANALTAQLRQIADADTAQRIAPDLVASINTLNPLTTQVKALYGVQANQAAIQANGPSVSAAQGALQQEQTRLLTGNCGFEGSTKSVAGGQSVTVNFTNWTPSPIAFYWIDFTGKRSPVGTVTPGNSVGQNTFVNHIFLAADASGTCIGLYQVTAAGTVNMNSPLSPTLGLYLSKLVK